MNEGSSLGVANWGTPTQFRGVALTDLLRKGRNLNFYLNSQFQMQATSSKLQCGPALCRPNHVFVGWLELLNHWFVTSMNSMQDLLQDLVHHLQHLPRLHQPFSAIITSTEALASCGNDDSFGWLVSIISSGIFFLETVLVNGI